jgi:hypothetical protein
MARRACIATHRRRVFYTSSLRIHRSSFPFAAIITPRAAASTRDLVTLAVAGNGHFTASYAMRVAIGGALGKAESGNLKAASARHSGFPLSRFRFLSVNRIAEI